jgi:MFS family permease
MSEQVGHDGTAQSGDVEPRVGVMAWFSVGILLSLTILSGMDRSIIALMVDPIKADLHITDVEFSLLQGFAFVLFYALASLPMAWIADRTSRHWVIFLGVTSWSIATALCGMAANFWQLFLARLGVGAGEATLTPSSYAMVGDLFPPRHVGLAIGMLAAGQAIGAAAAYGIGGLIVQWAKSVEGDVGLASWQLAFIIVGLPGVLVAPLVFLIPGRKRTKAAGVDIREIGEASYWRWLRANAGYLAPFFLGVGFHAILAYGTALWTPAYLGRHFGLGPMAIGGALALSTGVAGIVGFVGGGWITDRLHASSIRDAHIKYCLLNCVLVGVLGVITFTLVGSVALLIPLIAICHMLFPFTGPAVAHLQLTTPPEFRARTIALLTVTFNLIGMTLGPMSVAMFSDRIFGGPAHIGSGIALMFAVFAPLSAGLFALSIRPARRAVERMAASKLASAKV